MVKWPSLVLNEAGKANKRPFTIGLLVIAVLALLAYVGYFYNILPDVPHEIFESLIQVIAMLFGFTLIVIFYYQGKLHEHKKETLQAFFDFIEMQDEIFTLEKKYVEPFKEIVNLLPPAVLKGWFSEKVLEIEQNTETRRKELYSSYHQTMSSFKHEARSVRTKTLVLIGLFSISLLICFNGLFYTANEVEGQGWYYLASALMSITGAMLFFIGAWSGLQIVSEDLDKEYLKLRAAARIFGKKETNPKT